MRAWQVGGRAWWYPSWALKQATAGGVPAAATATSTSAAEEGLKQSVAPPAPATPGLQQTACLAAALFAQYPETVRNTAPFLLQMPYGCSEAWSLNTPTSEHIAAALLWAV